MWRWLAAVLAISLVVGCGDDAPDAGTGEAPGVVERSSIVLLSIDTLRADRLPAYGYAGVETPAIDTLAADGVVFRHAYTAVPLTLPAHVSMLTGLLPPTHGVRDNVGYPFDSGRLPYLPRKLHELGYATGGAVSVFLLHGSAGFGDGFELYDDQIESRIALGPGGIQRSGLDTLRPALDWLRTVAGRPFFLFLHLYEPHTPYTPPEPFASRYPSPYDGEIAAADHVVGVLLAALREQGVYDRTSILLVSDHGEGLGDHGEREHGVLLYRESLQVPMILKLPGNRAAGTRVEQPAHLVDVYPTLVELAGGEVEGDAPALSLLGLMTESKLRRTLYAETFYPRLHFGWSDLAALIDYPYQYIEGPEPELYNLDTDPDQTENVLRAERGVYARLRDELATYDRELQPPAAEEPDPERRAALAALGYLGTTVEVDGELPDPKAMLPHLATFERGIEQVARGELDAAVASFRAAVEESPAMVDAWEYLGQTLARLGRFDEAIAAYDRALELSGGAPRLAVAAARARAATGRWQETLDFVRQHLEIAPDELRLHLLESQALLYLERYDEAFAAAERALELAPDNADAHYQRGVVRMGQRQLAAAERDLRRALVLAPDHTAAMSDLALLLSYRGELAEARALLERLLRLMPGNQAAARQLAEIEREMGGGPE